MKCKQFERLIHRSMDDRLEAKEKKRLAEHLKSCPSCQQACRDYQWICDALKIQAFPDPKPYFWQRLQPRIRELSVQETWSLWKQWSLRAIPLSLLFLGMIAAGIVFWAPEGTLEMSQSGTLLLQNVNPLQETQNILGLEKIEDQSMMLIFTAMDDSNGIRRYFP